MELIILTITVQHTISRRVQWNGNIIWHITVEVGLMKACISCNFENPRKQLSHGKLKWYVISEFSCAIWTQNKIHLFCMCYHAYKLCRKGEWSCIHKKTTYFSHNVQKNHLCVIPCFENYSTKKVYIKPHVNVAWEILVSSCTCKKHQLLWGLFCVVVIVILLLKLKLNMKVWIVYRKSGKEQHLFVTK